MAGVVRFLGLGALLAWVGLAAAQNKAGTGSSNWSSRNFVSAKSEAVRTTALTGAAQGTAQQRGPRAPANDDCANAYTFDLLAGSPVTFYDDNTGATEDCAALSGGAYGDAWFKFTTVETLNVVIKYCGTSPAFYNAYIVMDTTCPCSGAFLFASSWEQDSCGDGNWSFYWNGLPAGTYYWPLLTDSAGGYAEGPYTVTFDASIPPPPPGCPENTLYGQLPMDQSGAWGAYTSAVGPNFEYTCYDNFSNLPEQIGGLDWWGLSMIFDPYYGWLPCGDPLTMTFELGFYTDAGGYPGTQVALIPVTPTITDVGPFSWTELYFYSVDEFIPCVPLSSGWLSIKSQAQYLGCVFLWLNSPEGDFSAYQQPAGGSFGQLGTDLAFCILDGCFTPIWGSCCDDYTAVCTDYVEWADCQPPLRYLLWALCADATPPCGIYGACCDAGLNCVFTSLEIECDAIQGRFFPGQTCPEWVCPNDCEHRVDLYDCYGDGWNGNTLDVLVNGVTVLSQITLPSGYGPLSYYFMAATGDTIQTIYYPIGGWPYEPYYYIYDGFGTLIGLDGIVGSDCYQTPTGITVTGNCNPPTSGACCYFAGGCDILPPDQCDPATGEFLGVGTLCSQCPCYVPCPPEGVPEQEPCGADTNGGCEMSVPTFEPIECGETICGTMWANYSLRDTDWYQIVTTETSMFTWTAECQVPVLIFIIQGAGPNDCSSYTILASATASECQPAAITVGGSTGTTYWFWVGPSSWNNWPCTEDYTATLTCIPNLYGACCLPNHTCLPDVLEQTCLDLAGEWQGEGSSCDPNPCPTQGTGAWICDEYISRVQVAEIDNSSGCETDCYRGEYTDLTATLPFSVSTPCAVTNGNPIWTADICSIWIDWNHDDMLNDYPPELIGDITGVGPYVFNITPPMGAPYGTALMRIRLDYANSNPYPCGCTYYGEVEDYTVNVLEVPGACCWADGTCTQELPLNCSGCWGGLYTQCADADCNLNGVDDFCDILSGTSTDCNGNGVPDMCEPWGDCNGNGIQDFCDLPNCDGSAWCMDCNTNGVLDYCDVPPPKGNCAGENCSPDCQPDGIPDECELDGGGGFYGQIDDGTSENQWGLTGGGELCWMNRFVANGPAILTLIGVCFGTPTSPGTSGVTPGQTVRVYVWSDPNQDGSPSDAVVLGEATGTVDASSIDSDLVQLVFFAGSGVPVNDSFFIGASVVTTGGYPAPADDDGQTQEDQGFLTFNSVPFDPTDLSNLYPMSALGCPTTVFILRTLGAGCHNDCNENGVPDYCDVPPPYGNCEGPDCSADCEPNGHPDECEPDCDDDGYPDECVIQYCEAAPWCSDCNDNHIPDGCDIADGTSPDCNDNGIPDECDIASGFSQDCNNNGIPDECDIASGYSQDCQPNGIPDECDIAYGGSQDCNGNGIPDECDIASGYSQDCQPNGILDECDIANCLPGELWCCDCNLNGVPDGCEQWTGGERDELLWDDGSSENSLGLAGGGEMCWLAHFTMPVQEMCVGQVQVCFGTPSYPGSSGVTAGQPVRVYVWKDPNGDGNPNDAVFLGEASGTADGASIDSDSFQSIPLSPWVRVHSSFFVGASVVTASGWPAPMDENGLQYNEAWVTFNTVPFDPTNITASLYNMTDIGYPCNWLLRAEIVYCSLPPDCNGNQIQDECDIGVEWGGYCATPGANCFPPECSSDWNHNGIPDECEVCGDLDNDGNVDLDDYWMFLDAFGTCVGDPKYNPLADMDGDGCVTLVDYQAWRMCYLMANGKEFVAPKPQPMPTPAKKAS